jgi:hypothetical protein
MKLRPDDLDDRSAYLLEKGQIRPPATTGQADQP